MVEVSPSVHLSNVELNCTNLKSMENLGPVTDFLNTQLNADSLLLPKEGFLAHNFFPTVHLPNFDPLENPPPSSSSKADKFTNYGALLKWKMRVREGPQKKLSRINLMVLFLASPKGRLTNPHLPFLVPRSRSM